VREPSVPVLEVVAKDGDALFEDRRDPVYPHTGRRLNPSLAEYLELQARLHLWAPSVELRVVLRSPSLSPAEEDRVRGELVRHFADEQVTARLAVRVNHREAIGFFRRWAPLLVVAVAVAGVFYLTIPVVGPVKLSTLVSALVYLVFITIVWVILWDPIEQLTYDAYRLKARLRALAKLQAASIRFDYAPPSPAPP
jgi:hypothetical protein